MALREFCTTNFAGDKQYTLTEIEWLLVETLRKVLEIPYIATKKMQAEFFTLSDFYGVWLEVSARLSPMSHPLARKMLVEMERRKADLMENPLMTSAIYLDPRFQLCLDEKQKEEAIRFLVALWQRIQKLTEQNEQETESENNEAVGQSDLIVPVHSNTEHETEKISYLEQLMRNIEIQKNATSKSVGKVVLDTIQQFNGVDRLPPEVSVIEFWNKNKNIEDVLYELASVIYSVSATQVPVERSFSGLKFILSDLRTNISQKCLEDILMIYLNKHDK